jgi:tetratricopeptide (TPR) repeat protein
VGFIFFIINILPALKIIPFGEYSIFNDRYTYFSSVGLFMTFFAGILFNDKKIKWIKILVGGILVSATISYSFLAKQRVAVWTNSEKMWLDVLNVYPKTSMALNNLGRVYLERNELELARIQFLKALEDRPDLALAYYNLGLVAKGQNDIKAALEYYHHAIALKPNYPEAFNNLGSLQSNLTEAVFSFRQAILIGADFPEVYYNLSLTYYRLKQYKEALLVLNIMHKKWPHENRGQRLEQEIQKNIP